MKVIWRILPWLFLALFAVEIAVVLLPKKEGEFHVREFGRLPVLSNGRIQPFDSVARNSLLQIRSTGDVPLEEVPSWKFWKHPKKIRSTEWLLEVMLKPELADTRPIFLIHHPDLLAKLKLADKGVEKSGLHYYTYDELKSSDDSIREEGKQISELKPESRTPYQKQALKLASAVVLYSRLKNSLRPEVSKDFARELADYQKAIPAGVEAARLSQAGKEHDKAALDRLMEPMQRFDIVSRMAVPLIVPPSTHSDETRDAWHNAGSSLIEAARSGSVHPAMTYYARAATAYRQGNAADFNQAIAEYRSWLSQGFAREVTKGRAEFYYNDIKLFLHCIIIYLFAFLLGGIGLVAASMASEFADSLRRSAYYLIILAFLAHTAALIYRMVLEGRPPVTNLYSSAVFIGWGAAVLGIVLERAYRVGIGNLVASMAGVITLIIAQNLALDGDTMEMMRAVLDTNFWLATHVVVVTLGYAATFVAGLLAVMYVLLGVLTPLISQSLRRPAANSVAAPQVAGATGLTVGQALTKMVYGIVCFATLFSFVGTILGGIWADQSWGRFWGWDPKENGALLIVIWNAIILHARWGGLVRERGLMNLAIFGNIITAWSWFGTNMLGIGLHSYGFMDAAFKWLMIFFISQLATIGLGLLPRQWWRSFQSNSPGGSHPHGRGSSGGSRGAAAALG